MDDKREVGDSSAANEQVRRGTGSAQEVSRDHPMRVIPNVYGKVRQTCCTERGTASSTISQYFHTNPP